MDKRKFWRGQVVVFARGFAAAASGTYEITALLPHDGLSFFYRIKSPHEPYERVAREDQLSVANF